MILQDKACEDVDYRVRSSSSSSESESSEELEEEERRKQEAIVEKERVSAAINYCEQSNPSKIISRPPLPPSPKHLGYLGQTFIGIEWNVINPQFNRIYNVP